METIVIGDVHGCAEELRALVALAAVDRVVLVGDLFTKGPDPAGVWRQIRDGGFDAVLGNQDARLLKVLEGKRPNDAHGRAVVDALDQVDLSWRPWLAARPLWAQVDDWLVVHAGVHPTAGTDNTSRRMALSMRQFPMDAPDAPLWHSQYQGTQRVLFGHDAMRGLVRVERKGKALLIGLDSGCVYGHQLSGYLIRQDRVIQVDAAREYVPPDLPTK